MARFPVGVDCRERVFFTCHPELTTVVVLEGSITATEGGRWYGADAGVEVCKDQFGVAALAACGCQLCRELLS